MKVWSILLIKSTKWLTTCTPTLRKLYYINIHAIRCGTNVGIEASKQHEAMSCRLLTYQKTEGNIKSKYSCNRTKLCTLIFPVPSLNICRTSWLFTINFTSSDLEDHWAVDLPISKQRVFNSSNSDSFTLTFRSILFKYSNLD